MTELAYMTLSDWGQGGTAIAPQSARIREWLREGREPAPWYTEQAAIIHRKLGQRDKEIAVLERWLAVCPPGRRDGSRIGERLSKLIA